MLFTSTIEINVTVSALIARRLVKRQTGRQPWLKTTIGSRLMRVDAGWTLYILTSGLLKL